MKRTDADQAAGPTIQTRVARSRLKRRGRTFSEGRRVQLRVEPMEERNLITESLGMMAGWGVSLTAGLAAASTSPPTGHAVVLRRPADPAAALVDPPAHAAGPPAPVRARSGPPASPAPAPAADPPATPAIG